MGYYHFINFSYFIIIEISLDQTCYENIGYFRFNLLSSSLFGHFIRPITITDSQKQNQFQWLVNSFENNSLWLNLC